MISKLRIAFFLVVVLLTHFSVAADDPAYQVDNVLVKVSLHQGDSIDKYVSISSDERAHFELSLSGLSQIPIDPSSFDLDSRESKNVKLSFLGSVRGTRVGSLRVDSDSSTSIIPIIFEVESSDPSFDISLDIPPGYAEITSEDKLVALVKVFDLTSGGTTAGLGPTTVTLTYQIYSLSGQEISSQSEEILVDRQTQVSKSFSFPSDLAAGDYVLAVSVIHGNSLGLASSVFAIGRKSGSLFSSDGYGNMLVYLIIGAFVFFLIIILLFVYFVRDRDKLILELRSHNDKEVEHLQNFLLQQEKMLQSKGADNQAIRREVDTKISQLKEHQSAREKELKHLSRKGDTEAMRKKIAQWKRSGYDTSLLEYKLNGLSTKEMKTILSKWKRQYRGEGYKNTR